MPPGLADVTVITSDNPRSEDPLAIIDDIVSGVNLPDRPALVIEPDRRAAIFEAIDRARPGDLVVIAGKGHETTQTIGEQSIPFDDREVAARSARGAERGSLVISVMMAGATAMFLGWFGTRFLISFFRERGRGQPILGKEDHGPEHHMAKAGTPTMGGLAIVVAAFVGWLVAHIRRRPRVLRPGDDRVGRRVLAMALMGFLDDFIKVQKRHNRGIFWKQKNYITMLMPASRLAWWLVSRHRHLRDDLVHPRRISRARTCPHGSWVLWAGSIIWATTNAVNVTDGLDGLAGGSALMGFGAFTIIAYWAFRNPTSTPTSSTRSTWGCSPRHSPGPAADSCGTTPRRRASSWAMSARSASAPHSPSARSRSTSTCCCC